MTPAEVDVFRASLAELRARPVAPVAFDSEVSRAVERGDLRTAVDRSRALIAEEPGSAMHHVRFARALLAVGFGHEARDEGQQAVELAPESAEVWAELGDTLSHDLPGLPFGEGWDRDGAIAAYQKALKLREEGSIVARLALVLEYGSDGERYGTEAQLSEAVELYARYRALEHSHEMETREAMASLRAGKCSRTRERLAWVSEDRERMRLLLTCAALEGGVDAAIQVLEGSEGGPSQRAEALERAAQLLTSLRRYALARAVLQAAERLSPASRDETFPELLAGVLRPKERAPSGPEQAVRTLLREAVEGRSAGLPTPGLDSVRKEHVAYVSAMASVFGSRRVGTELLLGALRVSVREVGANGWEVRTQGPWASAQTWVWHVAASGDWPTSVEPLEDVGHKNPAREVRLAAASARRNGEASRARAVLGPLVRDLDATPEDLELSVLDALANGNASEPILGEATQAVLATGREDADALRTLALVRLARGELARARALEVEATELDPKARPEGLAMLAEAWTRRALGFATGDEDVRTSLVETGPLADAVRNLSGRVPKAVALQGQRH
jgi:tetratricopeptide (TPR) repeat protein